MSVMFSLRWVWGSVFVLGALSLGCSRADAGAKMKGGELFGSTCSRCHGADGAGGVASYEGGPAPRNFRDHAFQTERTDEQLKQVIRNGKGSGMPPFGTMFDDAQLTGLVLHIRSLDSGKK